MAWSRTFGAGPDCPAGTHCDLDYALDPRDPYIVEADGDHYEEVYSLGPLVEQHTIHPILQLLMYPR